MNARRSALSLAAALLVLATLVPASGAHGAQQSTLQPAALPAAADVVGAGGVVSLPPSRILDTRKLQSIDGLRTRSLQVTGRGGIPLTDVAAVVLNVTVIGYEKAGHLTVYPEGTTRPNVSNVNFPPGAVVPNSVVVKVGANGRVALYNGSSAGVHVVVDVAGYVVGGAATAPGAVASLVPARLLDTRTTAPVPALGTHSLRVAGRGGVPVSGVSAVILNLTAVAPRSAGHVTAYPSGSARPTASNLNFAAGQVVANLVVVKVGGDGRVALHNGSAGAAHLLADVAGYVVAGTADVPGAVISLAPARLLDTRSSAPVTAGGTTALRVTGRGGVPPDGVGAVVLNVTAVRPAKGGHLTAYPAGSTRPTASNLNFVPGQVVANLVVVEVGAGGQVALFNGSAGSTHLVVDVAGYIRPGRGDGSYRPQALPGTGAFAGLACAAPDDCVASRWSDVEPGSARVLEIGASSPPADTALPLPDDADVLAGSGTSGAACSGDGTCVLPGWYVQDDGAVAAFAATRRDGSWTTERLDDPAPDEASVGEVVDCAPTGGCVVITQLLTGDQIRPTAHRLVDGAWVPTPMPVPAYASGDVEVQDVACPAADRCTAVGRWRTGDQQERLATWVLGVDGWTVAGQQIYSAVPEFTFLTTFVDCASPTRCALALSFEKGEDGGHGELWLGRSNGDADWQRSTSTSSVMDVTGLDCEPSGTCTAIGAHYADDFSTQWPIVRRLVGSTWSAEYPPAPESYLTGISCVDATSCTVIGEESEPIVLTRTAAGWQRAQVVGEVEWLTHVSCQDPRTCTVLGESFDPSEETRGWLIR
jgi:hypothetical protein